MGFLLQFMPTFPQAQQTVPAQIFFRANGFVFYATNKSRSLTRPELLHVQTLATFGLKKKFQIDSLILHWLKPSGVYARLFKLDWDSQFKQLKLQRDAKIGVL